MGPLQSATAIAQAVPQLRGRNEPQWINYYLPLGQLSQRAFSDRYVLAAGGVLLVVGLLLLTLAIRHGPRPLRLVSTAERVRVVMPVRQLRRVAAAAAYAVEDVAAVKVKARRRRVRVTAITHPDGPADLTARVHDQVTSQLDGLAPARRRPRVKVRLKRKGR